MKKNYAFFMLGFLAIALAGCGAKPQPQAEAETAKAIETTAPEPTSAPSPQTPKPSATPAPTAPETNVNLIPGGSFDAENSKWGLYKESGGSASMATTGGELKITIDNTGKLQHSVQAYCDGFELLCGGKYKLSFDIYATTERTIDWRVQINGGDYHAYAGQESVPVTTNLQTVTYEFTMEEASDPAPRLCFNMGMPQNGEELSPHEVHIDNVSLMLLDASGAQTVDTSTDAVDININQIGYRPDEAKVAIFRNAGTDKSFEIIDAAGTVVYTGEVTGSYQSNAAGEAVAYGDFSDFKAPGEYTIRSDSGKTSYAFKIDAHVYDDIFVSVNKMLTMQRCGSELTTEIAGDFAHPACHTQTTLTYEGGKKTDATGGWHDAGDYGRYIVPAAKAVADLLLAYENYPSAFTDDTGIAESGNGTPDVLDEARYELDWMFKMQFADGGVSHKVTPKNFSGMVLAQDATDDLYVLPASKTASADFAAVMYLAARVYEASDPSYAKKCLAAADKAFAYFEVHKDDYNFTNPSDISTGEYPDHLSKDEYLWALCERYKTTKDTDLLGKIKEFEFDKLSEEGLGWQCVTLYAYYAYLSSDVTSAGIRQIMQERFDSCVNEVIENIKADGYHASIKGSYPWGSNMTIANNGMLLLLADKLNGSDANQAYAKYQLDYLLGATPTSYCYVTGFGSMSPKDTHHRPSQALQKTMPGMLVGGPDSNLEDPYAKATLNGKPPALCYADNSQSYSCNEITIYWNSPLIYLMAGLK